MKTNPPVIIYAKFVQPTSNREDDLWIASNEMFDGAHKFELVEMENEIEESKQKNIHQLSHYELIDMINTLTAENERLQKRVEKLETSFRHVLDNLLYIQFCREAFELSRKKTLVSSELEEGAEMYGRILITLKGDTK